MFQRCFMSYTCSSNAAFLQIVVQLNSKKVSENRLEALSNKSCLRKENQMKSSEKIKWILFLVIGCISIVLCIMCFVADTGVFKRESAYGGDAYTGIQNAAAITANNVKCVAEIVSTGFGSILLVFGLYLIAVSILNLVDPFLAQARITSNEQKVSQPKTIETRDNALQENNTDPNGKPSNQELDAHQENNDLHSQNEEKNSTGGTTNVNE